MISAASDGPRFAAGEIAARTAENIHATAIVIGTAGIAFFGPSGAGKSSMALRCLWQARQCGLFSALIADDRVIVWRCNGRVLAKAPQATAGLAELRGTGILTLEPIGRAVLHLAVLPGGCTGPLRLPENDECQVVGRAGSLPAMRLCPSLPEPLAAIAAMHPKLFRL